MKILELEIHNIRGIRHLRLDPLEKNMLIVGPNGSGKSSVVDSIDFLLTGRITRLTGKGTGKIFLNRHGPHIDSKPEDAIVTAKIRLPGNNKVVSLKRCIAQPNQLECDPLHLKTQVEELGRLALHGHHVLTRREILRYITAEEGTRAQEIQALLDLSEVEDIRQSFTKVQNDSEKARNNAIRALGIAKGQVSATTQQQDFQEARILEFVNQHRALLKGQPIEALRFSSLKSELKAPVVVTDGKQSKVSLLEKDIQNITTLLQPEEMEGFGATDTQLRDIIFLLHANPDLLHGYSYQSLIEMGLSLVDESGDCPLCGSHWEPGKLIDHLEDELSRARLSAQYQQQTAALTEKLLTTINFALASVEKLAAAAQLVDLPDDYQILQGWKNELENLSRALSKPVEQYTPDRFERKQVCTLYAPKNIFSVFNRVDTAVKERFPNTTPEQVSWDTLTRLEENLKALERAQSDYDRADIAYQRASLLETEFEKARDEILGKLYETIKKRFVELYSALHDTDEDKFDAIMKPEGAGLVLDVDFHGRGIYPPHAMHSEGHQDSMGLCLYLALAEHLTKGKIDTIILDDVVMSVDADHRRQLCQVFKKFFPTRQIIIATHDKTWASQLKSEGVITSRSMIEFYNWDLIAGPQVNSSTDMWILIQNDLDKNDIPAAAAKLRRGSEEYFATVCDALQAFVRYKENGKWELGDFLPSAIGQYRDLLKNAQKSALSWGIQDQTDKLKELESLSSQVIARTNAEQWGINAAVHYNQWVNLTRNDFVPLVEAFQDLWDLFRCSECGSVLRVATRGLKPIQVYCSCGKVNWNLQKKNE